ncbi:aminopeptidase [Flavobacterium branchiophilum]|uniref:Aminopeptidase n=1 Tax=Flavobacterium branchiophilum TaxID=55197 RepID=A0A543G7A6_9FLAO|nr:C1 family peptidase [Flavobacterium branchiophilum]OXA65973.1 aminopeptidase [Flavobacterium branchiophilum] [Flavobacterium branchiophilum NBRC 15030 = ATCC 35035]TQM41971.1 bleomycin hydrolase [Flavobacterium branchiophilum]GEM55068.1 aminopeptidase [Flavobacterium branchiophilum NBRC 15030 = ATCC 35035]
MMRKHFIVAGLLSSMGLFAQDDLVKKVINNASINSKFIFTDVINLESTSVKSQGSAGTCWSYSGNSFIESEMIRMGKKPVDIAEIFTARKVYLGKARNYILFNGNLGLGDGAELHDVMNMLRQYGAMPQEAYTLEDYGKGSVKSDDFQNELKDILDNYIKLPKKTAATWLTDVNQFMDQKLGKLPENFDYKGKNYNSHSFAKEVIGINPDDYIEISNYKDSPYYQKIVQPVSDNWSYDQLYNVPMTALTDVVDAALSKGYTVGWATDVSEPYFSWKNGVAQVPDLDLYNITDEQRKGLFEAPLDEKKITEDLRLDGFYTMTTTDDHGMHIVGKGKDQKGKEYYKVKNSWGASNDFKGYLYVTKAYVQLKTTALMVHKKALPMALAKKLKL